MLFLVASVCAVIGAVSGCSCMGGHPQRNYCSAEFVIKGVVTSIMKTSGDPINAEKVYIVDVEEVFKGEDVLQGAVTLNISTPAYGSRCGVHLHEQSVYLLLGKANVNGDLRIHLCDGNKPFAEVSDAELDGMSGDYDCDCGLVLFGEYEENDEICYGPEVIKPDDSDKCQTDYDSCSKVDDKCRWRCRE